MVNRRSALLPRSLTRSLHVRHLTLACRFEEAEPEPCPLPSAFSPSLSLSVPLHAPAMAEQSRYAVPPSHMLVGHAELASSSVATPPA